ncbi:MAG TPA: metalloregulator ArsR/SmtB family transcription factor [Longimicrobiales bacterium]|nr:metalloregulator ArsR/SmtB family transcription factor [Longimicrobiales bacterium]
MRNNMVTYIRMDVASAIADPVRRDILVLLRDGVLTAGEIAACFDISRPAVSRHLRVLRECGLIVDEVHGRERRYHLDIAPLGPLEAWLAALHDPWSGRLDALETEVYRTRRDRRVSKVIPRGKSA